MTLLTSQSEQRMGQAGDATTDEDVVRYARCIEVSKRMRWRIEDVIQGRQFDPTHNFLPNGFIKAAAFPSLSSEEIRFVSQIQGRTYANMFGLLERYVNAKVLELSQDHWFGDQTKLEALIRFSDEEMKHQHLFRRVEVLVGAVMPDGYRFTPQPNPVARAILGKSTWAVLALTLLVEIVTQAHYRESIAEGAEVSPLYKDVFRYHWMEECQHAILDELEWRREDRKLSSGEREAAVEELIELVFAIDDILQVQAMADTEYFLKGTGRKISQSEAEALAMGFLKAYRWQYIHSGAQHPQFLKVLSQLITEEQGRRIRTALGELS